MARKNTNLAVRSFTRASAAQLHVISKEAARAAATREAGSLESAAQLIRDAQETARSVSVTVASGQAAVEIRAAAVALSGAIEHLETAIKLLEHDAR